jgi:hypothetical protein
MNRPGDLFDLIKSMTRSEKRYFKLSASPQKGEKNYLRLFDAIDRQKSYDEEAIRSAFEGEAFVRQLHVAKNYLFRLILRSLRAYRAESSIDAEIECLMQDAGILYDKGLTRLCSAALKRARQLAEEYERDIRLLEIIRMEDTYIPAKSPTREALDRDYDEWREVLKRIENAGDYDYLANRISLVLMYRGIPRGEEDAALIDEVMRHPLLTDERAPLSTSARRRFNYIHAGYHYSRGETARALIHVERSVQLSESRFEHSSEYANGYVGSLTNLLLLLSDAGEDERFHDALRKMRSFPEKLAEHGFSDERLIYRIFNFSTGIEMNHYNSRGEFERGVAMIPVVEEGCERLRRYISSIDEIRFNYSIAWSLFGIGEHARALGYLNRVLEHSDMQGRQHVLYSAKILNLIIHYELGNVEHIEHLVKSTYRFLSRRNNLFALETVLLHYFRKLPALKSRHELTAWFGDLREELTPLADSPFEKQAFAYFNYLPWLQSKVEGRSLAETMRRPVQAPHAIMKPSAGKLSAVGQRGTVAPSG